MTIEARRGMVHFVGPALPAVLISVMTLIGTSLVAGAQTTGLHYQHLHIDGRFRGCIPVATSVEAQERGLRGVTASNARMAFLFAKPGLYGFWMEGVARPITIAWVSEGRVVGAVAMAPESTTVYSPPVPIRLAVEFMAGRGLPAIGSRLRLGATC